MSCAKMTRAEEVDQGDEVEGNNTKALMQGRGLDQTVDLDVFV